MSMREEAARWTEDVSSNMGEHGALRAEGLYHLLGALGYQITATECQVTTLQHSSHCECLRLASLWASLSQRSYALLVYLCQTCGLFSNRLARMSPCPRSTCSSSWTWTRTGP